MLTDGGEAKPSPVINERLAAAHRHAVGAARAVGARAGLTLAMTGYETDGSAEADALLAPHRAVDEDFFLETCREDDFFGVQAYSTRFVTAQEILPFGQGFGGPYPTQTMMGWSFTPDTIGKCVRRAHALAPDLPLIVTENGIATEDDEQRIAYADGALRSVLAAIADGVPVEGYLHWSLLDNYEWVHGFRPTFGLIAVDRTTFERTPKPSLGWLGRVAKANCLP
jgi:beta-glucosidase